MVGAGAALLPILKQWHTMHSAAKPRTRRTAAVPSRSMENAIETVEADIAFARIRAGCGWGQPQSGNFFAGCEEFGRWQSSIISGSDRLKPGLHAAPVKNSFNWMAGDQVPGRVA